MKVSSLFIKEWQALRPKPKDSQGNPVFELKELPGDMTLDDFMAPPDGVKVHDFGDIAASHHDDPKVVDLHNDPLKK